MSDNFQTEYSLELQQERVTIGGTLYILKEATEDAACQYRNAAIRGAVMERVGADGSKISMGAAADVEPLLVSLCLFECDKDGVVLRNVPLAIVRGWPARVVKPLFDKVKAMSLLDETGDTKAKN